MALQTPPFYVDWTFWAAAMALVAIVLSQIPPLRVILRPKRLEVDVHSRIRITHAVGNPNASILVGLRNTGGRQLRVQSMALDISRDGKPISNLPSNQYFEMPSSTSTVLFVPFNINPGDAWTHSVTFLNENDRLTEKALRKNVSELQTDIRIKLQARPTDQKNTLVEAEVALVTPFYALMDERFVWFPGEYVAELSVLTQPGSASFKKKYRFTLFESDTEDLRAHKDDYKYGGGIAYNVDTHAGSNIPLTLLKD